MDNQTPAAPTPTAPAAKPQLGPESIDRFKEHFKHACELYAAAKGYQLTPFADKIINRCITVCNGCCPCDVSRGLCPCKEHVEEVATKGHCHCNLFKKP